MGVKPKKKTEKGKPSTDVEALEALDYPFITDLLRMRKLQKAHNTFLAGILREVVDGRMHPFFNLHNVKSYRGSSDSPNFQNLPIRDREQSKLVRGAIIPSPGHQLVEIDYSGIEVCIAACYHHDPAMLSYIEDKSKDMHRDMAAECYDLPISEVSKNIRYCGKNRFVFPQFYGDYWKSCAKALWDAVDAMRLETASKGLLRDHLTNRGLKSLKAFEGHIERVERRFWGKRFPVYAKWKENHWEKYLETGYIDLHTGFRCSGLAKKNEVINWPVQGSAFHCLLWSLIKVNDWLRTSDKRSHIIGQIHDAILFDAHPEEVEEIIEVVEQISCHDIREHWPWIITPLEVEVDITPIDGSWITKETYK
jgi:DNA polymerase-1